MAESVQLSARQARRIALNAALLATPRKRAGPAAFAAVLERLAMLQIDSVNVLARAHTVPHFSRLGAYDAKLLSGAAYGRRRTLFEYWGHEASLIRLDLQPSLRWRMARARAGVGIYGALARFGRERPDFVASTLAAVEARGPLTARDLGSADASGKGAGGWWGWSDGKRALEWLFWGGLLTTRTRRNFERVYDLPERVFPAVAALPTPDEPEAQRRLLMAAAAALGVATAGDLRNYWRIGPADALPRIAELVEAGALSAAEVKGWKQPAYMLATIPAGAPTRAAALVSPFDPLLWERDRVERLFGIRYRIEIYTPAAQREHGYYVLPFLLRDRIAARLDLKADRAGGQLIVSAAHLERGAEPDAVAEAVAAELAELARWLGLERIAILPRGDLAPHLAARPGLKAA